MAMRNLFVGVCAALLLAGCWSSPETKETGQSVSAKKFMGACNVEGLAGPGRQTVILIDPSSLVKSTGGSDFSAKNARLRDALLAIADPDVAGDTGNLAPRELVTVFLTSPTGAAPQLIFSGCAPSLTEAERTQLEKNNSTIGKASDTFFGRGTANEIKEQKEGYREALIASLNVASQAKADGGAERDGGFAQSAFVASIRSATRLYDPAGGMARMVLIAPGAIGKAPSYPNPVEARKAGFADAKNAGLDLAGVEVVVAMANSDRTRNYLDAFMLGSGGDLVAFSNGAPSGLPGPPMWRKTYVGTIAIGGETYPAEARIAVDARGNLVNSWLEMRGISKKTVPLSGMATCRGAGKCDLRSDDRGFAHRFYADRSEAAIGSDGSQPFGGMRRFEMAIDQGKLVARVYDPGISQIGDDPNAKDFRFTLSERT
ncbi:hypothetical protein FPZ54_07720 [Sphingomonas suaedae]|uniref:Uncharacterized protein n=1 Tax=Sphingomonas suaedae TaxID=2599297 RepID=A0A518REL8_9SPHN|nr:hypothetical protein [Sphingomonas suaedae]QDX25922.1 hypothetical protein FPZ54_07720 [Sphingomonas suaedae]